MKDLRCIYSHCCSNHKGLANITYSSFNEPIYHKGHYCILNLKPILVDRASLGCSNTLPIIKDINAYSIWSRLWGTALHWVASMCFLFLYWPISILLVMISIRGPDIIMDIPVSSIMKPIMGDRTSWLWRLQCIILIFFSVF